MSKRELSLGDGLKLPLAAITQRFGFLGTIGSGKTYGATKLAECMLDAGAQIVAIDPVGVWWGLRAGAKKGEPGFSIPVFGGLHGDVPLEPGSGRRIADLIVDRRISAVIDLSQIEFDTDRAKWLSDFGARFFFRKQQKPSAVHLFFEEAQEILPEEPQKNETLMLHVFVRMAKLGRNFGIGMSLITQRPQDTSKKALNLTECVLAFRIVGPHERAAIKRWVDYKGAPAGILDALPTLETGHARIVSREWLKIDDTYLIGQKRTADVSSTPKHGARKIKQRELTPVDLDVLRKEMAETLERAKADDPAELRKELAELRREHQKLLGAAARESAKPAAPVVKQKIVVIGGPQAKRMEAAGKMMCEAVNKFNAANADLAKLFSAGNARVPVPPPIKPPAHIPPAKRPISAPPPRPPAATGEAFDDIDLGAGERRLAVAIAQLGEAGKAQLIALAGFKKSSCNEYLRRLIRYELVIERAGWYQMTPKGLVWLGPYEPLPTGQDLIQYWIGKLPGGESAVFKAVSEQSGIEREAIDTVTGFKKSTRNEYLRRLDRRKLVVFEGTTVQLAPALAG